MASGIAERRGAVFSNRRFFSDRPLAETL